MLWNWIKVVKSVAGSHPRYFQQQMSDMDTFWTVLTTGRLNPCQQQHTSFLLRDYQNTKINYVWLNFLLCLLGDWGLRKRPQALCAVEIKQRYSCCSESWWQPWLSQLSGHAVGKWWCGFEAVFANSCSNLLCLEALNSSGGRMDDGHGSRPCC